MKIGQSVPKRRHMNFRRRGITRKRAYNIQNTAKVWNQEASVFCAPLRRYWIVLATYCIRMTYFVRMRTSSMRIFRTYHDTRLGFLTDLLTDFRRLQNCAKRLLSSSCLSVRPLAWNNSAPTRRIFMIFDVWVFFEKMPKRIKFHKNLTRITGTLHEDQFTFFNHISFSSS